MGQTSSQNIVYSVPVGDKHPKGTRVYRNPKATGELICYPNDQIQTLQDVFLKQVKAQLNNDCFGTKNQETNKFEFISYGESKAIADAIGTFMVEKQLYHEVEVENRPNMRLLGIFAKNRKEWLLQEQANFLYNLTYVPLYDTLGPDSIDYVLNQTELTTIVASVDAVEMLIKCKNPGNLKNIVFIDPIGEELRKNVEEKGWQLYDFWKIVEEYKQKQAAPYEKITGEHIFTFSYTSGTTGDPKGALISHKNIVSVAYQTQISLERKIDNTDVYLSYLPLPHIFERIMVYAIIYNGGSIGFYSGDVQKLKEDIASIRPTVFASVPRLYNRFYDAIKSNIDAATGVKGYLAKNGLKTKMDFNEIDNAVEHKFWDKLVFNKTKQALGGRVKIAATGSAPISQEVLKYLKCTLCVPLQEGYGSTETTGATFQTSIYDPKVGHVGGVNPNMEFRLEDIPDMNYLSTDVDQNGKPAPRGEICIRGNAVFCGYYKLPEKTAEAIDSEGWLHTGDVGQILENGALKIIDRKKNLFKLAQGEYVAPEKVENIYVTSSWVDEVWVHGDSLEPTLVTFAVANQKKATQWAQENKVEYSNMSELLKNKDLRKTILKDLTALGKTAKLFGFEQAKNIQLVEKPFMELGITTNTFKIKRKDARDYFANDIKALYNEKL